MPSSLKACRRPCLASRRPEYLVTVDLRSVPGVEIVLAQGGQVAAEVLGRAGPALLTRAVVTNQARLLILACAELDLDAALAGR
jgi:hypothetical protein